LLGELRRVQLQRVDALIVSGAFPSLTRPVLAEIYLCHACACQAIEGRSAPAGAPHRMPAARSAHGRDGQAGGGAAATREGCCSATAATGAGCRRWGWRQRRQHAGHSGGHAGARDGSDGACGRRSWLAVGRAGGWPGRAAAAGGAGGRERGCALHGSERQRRQELCPGQGILGRNPANHDSERVWLGARAE
jgi:hypothetical protein